MLEFLLLQVLNGACFSLLLFFVAAGMSVVFGLMNLANLAHGGFYMLGGYLALTLVSGHASFWVALAVVPVAIGLLGGAIEWSVLRPVYRRDHLDQVLVTLGFAYVFWDLANWVWGGDIHLPAPPDILAGSVRVLGQPYPLYRIAVLVAGLALAAALCWVEARTRFGAILRAGVSDPQMLAAMGVNVPLVFTLTFCLGAALAGLGGVVAGPIMGVYRGIDFEILILATVVVVVGGLGSLKGTFLSSLLIGTLDSFGKVYFPGLALVSIFLIMAVVLVLRPTGLTGIGRSTATA